MDSRETAFELDRFEQVPASEDAVLLRVEGRWPSAIDPHGRAPRLVAQLGGTRRLLVALPGDGPPAGAAVGDRTWQAAFSAPVTLVSPQTRFFLELDGAGGCELPMPVARGGAFRSGPSALPHSGSRHGPSTSHGRPGELAELERQLADERSARRAADARAAITDRAYGEALALAERASAAQLEVEKAFAQAHARGEELSTEVARLRAALVEVERDRRRLAERLQSAEDEARDEAARRRQADVELAHERWTTQSAALQAERDAEQRVHRATEQLGRLRDEVQAARAQLLGEIEHERTARARAEEELALVQDARIRDARRVEELAAAAADGEAQAAAAARRADALEAGGRTLRSQLAEAARRQSELESYVRELRREADAAGQAHAALDRARRAEAGAPGSSRGTPGKPAQ